MSKKELYTLKMIQKTNATYLELHTYTSRQKNSESFVQTSQRLDMCSASHTADVEMIIQLIPNFVQCVPSDGSYGNCDLLPQLWQRLQQGQDKHFVFYVAPQGEVARS
jgi:hypothetical protein